jgi:hypothetical protein
MPAVAKLSPEVEVGCWWRLREVRYRDWRDTMGFMDRIKKWFKADKELASSSIPQADPEKAPEFTPQGVQETEEEKPES